MFVHKHIPIRDGCLCATHTLLTENSLHYTISSFTQRCLAATKIQLVNVLIQCPTIVWLYPATSQNLYEGVSPAVYIAVIGKLQHVFFLILSHGQLYSKLSNIIGNKCVQFLASHPITFHNLNVCMYWLFTLHCCDKLQRFESPSLSQ